MTSVTWSTEHDRDLQLAYKQHGKDWTKIAATFESKSWLECKERICSIQVEEIRCLELRSSPSAIDSHKPPPPASSLSLSSSPNLSSSNNKKDAEDFGLPKGWQVHIVKRFGWSDIATFISPTMMRFTDLKAAKRHIIQNSKFAHNYKHNKSKKSKSAIATPSFTSLSFSSIKTKKAKKSVPTSVKKIQCSNCGKIFQSRQLRQLHTECNSNDIDATPSSSSSTSTTSVFSSSSSSSRRKRRAPEKSVLPVSKRQRGTILCPCTIILPKKQSPRTLLNRITTQGYCLMEMTEEEKLLLSTSVATLQKIVDNKWSNISLNSLSGPNKKVTQMLKACDLLEQKGTKKLWKKEIQTMSRNTTNVLLQGYYRMLNCTGTPPLNKSSPNVVKIQWLRSFNVRASNSKDTSSDGSNAQDLHRDYEHEVAPDLIAHSVIFTLEEPSHLIVLQKSHLMSEQNIDDAEKFQILEIPPYSMVFFHSQLAHAGPLFHDPNKPNLPHHFRGFAYLVKTRYDLPDSGGRKRWVERVFLKKKEEKRVVHLVKKKKK